MGEAGCVEPAGAAVARRGARHREDLGEAALVEGRGDLLRGAPGAARLIDHKPLTMARAGCVVSPGDAVARRGARHRVDLGIPAAVEGRGYLMRGAPGAVRRTDHKRMRKTGAVGVVPAGAAVARRAARHRADRGNPARVEGRGYLMRGAPGAVRLIDHKPRSEERRVGKECSIRWKP